VFTISNILNYYPVCLAYLSYPVNRYFPIGVAPGWSASCKPPSNNILVKSICLLRWELSLLSGFDTHTHKERGLSIYLNPFRG
jgi:hypothetical protein